MLTLGCLYSKLIMKYKIDNISSQDILRHNNIFNRYLPALPFLAQPLFMRASARELVVPFFTPLVWCSPNSNHTILAPKADALPTNYRGVQYGSYLRRVVNAIFLHRTSMNRSISNTRASLWDYALWKSVLETIGFLPVVENYSSIKLPLSSTRYILMLADSISLCICIGNYT